MNTKLVFPAMALLLLSGCKEDAKIPDFSWIRPPDAHILEEVFQMLDEHPRIEMKTRVGYSFLDDTHGGGPENISGVNFSGILTYDLNNGEKRAVEFGLLFSYSDGVWKGEGGGFDTTEGTLDQDFERMAETMAKVYNQAIPLEGPDGKVLPRLPQSAD